MVRILAAALVCWVLALAPAAAQAPAPHTSTRFEFLQDKQILFPVTINGLPAEAWLDSGASATVVDAAFARSIGLKLEDTPVRARGVAGQVGGVRLAQAALKIADLDLPIHRVAVMDFSAVARVVPRPVQVILGREVFENAIVDIDFSTRTLAVLPREGFQPPPVKAIPLRRSGGLRSFPIRIGRVHTEAILDLGNAGALLLDRQFADEKRLFEGRPTSTQLSVGADGVRESLVGALNRVQVGGAVFNGVGAVAALGLASQAPANVGLEILSRFHVTVDFAGDRLWLQPLSGAENVPFRKNRSGFALVPEGDRLRISHVAPGSPAAKAGFKVGEKIAAIDGQPIAADYAASDLSRWIFRPAGRQVALTMADGSRRTLRLADYY
jgi:predicted aspartyl protease